MQTFLPYPNFAGSARVLDRQRLGKQRVEVLQLLNALTGKSAGWRNHPAAKMWAGHEDILAEYGIACCEEWKRRGYVDTCGDKISNIRIALPRVDLPHWLGDQAFHRSHQSNLLRKDFWHYREFKWDVPDNLPYVWPTP